MQTNKVTNKIITWTAVIVVGFSLILCAWSLLHNDIYYNTDIGRDFLIFEEIAAKKIVLIGPRADFQGLFHGVLWHYLQMPAFLIGRGNPVTVGWWWFLLTCAFITGNYCIAKNLFDKKSAVIAVVLFSAYLVPYVQGFFHGSGAMLILPAFFYFFIRYMRTADYRFLIAHLVVLGMLVQFEIAIGIPFLILDGLAVLFLIIKKRKFLHVICFAVLVLFFTNFILTDLRHNFLQFKSILAYSHGSRDAVQTPFMNSLKDRFDHITSRGFNVFNGPFGKLNILLFFFYLYAFFNIFRKHDKKKPIFLAFLYFYVGYYVVTLLHGGYIIELWRIPLSVLPLLIFASLHNYSNKWIYYSLFSLMMVATFIQNLTFINTTNSQIGKNTRSWKFHFLNASALFSDAPDEFGYFIYSPDVYGYQDKYAMSYAARVFKKQAYKFEKKPVTYVLIEPPPPHELGLSPEWWIEHKVHISNAPAKKIPLGSNYAINKYVLTSEEVKIPSEVTPADWLYFR